MKKKQRLKYDNLTFSPGKLDRENIDRMAIEQVPQHSFVLDIGCATGFMGEYLKKEKSCRVFGVEVRLAEALLAKKKLEKVYIGDIEEENLIKKIEKDIGIKKFDCILATSVLEHLVDPALVIKRLLQLLSPKGIIIATTPNIAHWSTRLSLFFGKFTYTEYGILDNTHLHFYTMKTFQFLFRENGYNVTHILIDPVGGGYPKISRLLAKIFPGMFAYQILVIAKKKQ